MSRHDDGWKELWRNSRKAPPEEKWKWDHYIWEPVLEEIWIGNVDRLTCPICGHERVYFKHLAFREIKTKNERRIMSDLWVGCEQCGIQIRETVLVPDWLKADVEWSPGSKR